MSVFTVSHIPGCSCQDVVGVFSSRERASAFVNTMRPGTYVIQGWIVDLPSVAHEESFGKTQDPPGTAAIDQAHDTWKERRR
jgi:hypothetical protein